MDQKIDARKLSLDFLEEKRREAHRLRKRGMTGVEIGAIAGIHADTIGRWLKLDKQLLGYDKPGRKHGSGQRLDAEQEQRNKKQLKQKASKHMRKLPL